MNKETHFKNEFLAAPRTIGELKEAIKDFPDEIPFGFRNQPFQVLYQDVVAGNTHINFQFHSDPDIDAKIEIFDPTTASMQLAILRNIQKDMSDSERKYANWTFVNRYLLFHTEKSGRTSSYVHCQFLGIDPEGHSFW